MQTKTYIKVTLVLGVLASVFYLWQFFLNPAFVTDPAYQGALRIVFPHLVATWLATLITLVCLFKETKGLVLMGAGLYGVAVALFPSYMMYVIIQAALLFTAYLKIETSK